MLGSAPQPSLIPRVPAGTGTGGGCGGDLASSPGTVTDEPALTLEMKPTLQLQPDSNLNAACGQGSHFKSIIGKFGPDTLS